MTPLRALSVNADSVEKDEDGRCLFLGRPIKRQSIPGIVLNEVRMRSDQSPVSTLPSPPQITPRKKNRGTEFELFCCLPFCKISSTGLSTNQTTLATRTALKWWCLSMLTHGMISRVQMSSATYVRNRHGMWKPLVEI